jgi:4-hydroxybenzoate polyprenyltransferase
LRPIPSGRISPAAALAIAVTLVVLGVCSGLLVHPRAGALLGAVAVLAVLYDLCARGAWRGPLLLGACRAGNLGFGVLAGSGGSLPEPWVLGGLAAYGLYVFSISRIGRLEDAPWEQVGAAPSLWLMMAAASMLAVPFVRLVEAGIWAAFPLALVGAGLLVRTALPVRDWPRAQLVPTMGRALRLLLVMTAALALCVPGTQGLWTAGLVLCGYPVAHQLAKRFPPS